MSTKPTPRTPGSASPETPSSPTSPRSQREAVGRGRFSLPTSPRLDTITEHLATTHVGRHGSVSSISFLPPTELPGVSWAASKPREKGRRRTLSPPAPRLVQGYLFKIPSTRLSPQSSKRLDILLSFCSAGPSINICYFGQNG